MRAGKLVHGLAFILGSALATSVAAVEPHWFAGFGAGKTSTDISESDINKEFAAEGITAFADVDDEDTAWRVFGGYRISDYFAVEAGYLDFGTVEADVNISDPVTGTANIDADVTAFTLDLLIPIRLSERFELIPRIGVAFWDVDADLKMAAGGLASSASVDDDGTDFHYGIGLSAKINERIKVRTNVERIDSDAEITAFTIGLQFTL
jgi:OOP family OmpA-OmpF porin